MFRIGPYHCPFVYISCFHHKSKVVVINQETGTTFTLHFPHEKEQLQEGLNSAIEHLPYLVISDVMIPVLMEMNSIGNKEYYFAHITDNIL